MVITNVDTTPRNAAAADAAKKRKEARAKVAEKEGREMTELPARILPLIWKEFERQNKAALKFTVPFDGKKNVYTAGLFIC